MFGFRLDLIRKEGGKAEDLTFAEDECQSLLSLLQKNEQRFPESIRYAFPNEMCLSFIFLHSEDSKALAE
jgi:hypothetical protein